MLKYFKTCKPLFDKGNSFDLTVPNTLTSRVYYVDGRSDLMSGDWSEVTNKTGNNGSLVFELADSADTKFYRARAKLK